MPSPAFDTPLIFDGGQDGREPKSLDGEGPGGGLVAVRRVVRVRVGDARRRGGRGKKDENRQGRSKDSFHESALSEWGKADRADVIRPRPDRNGNAGRRIVGGLAA